MPEVGGTVASLMFENVVRRVDLKVGMNLRRYLYTYTYINDYSKTLVFNQFNSDTMLHSLHMFIISI